MVNLEARNQSANILPSGEEMLQELGIDPTQLKLLKSPQKRSNYRAVLNWLTKYNPNPDVSNLEKLKGSLEAFFHLCEIEDWEAAKNILLTPLDSFGKKHILRQILDWSLYREGIPICQKILKKSTFDADVVFLNMLGNDYLFLGNYPIAKDYYEQSLAIAQELGDRQGEGNALGNLGIVYRRLGQYERAIDFYQQQLVITQEIGDRESEGNALGNLGIAYFSIGQYERAIDFYQQQLAITQEIGDRQGEDNALGNLGFAYLSIEQYEQGINFHQKALVISREIGDRQGESNALGSLGVAYHRLGQYDRAVNFHQQALIICREIGDYQGEGIDLVNMGATQIKLEQYPESLINNQAALEIFRDIGDQENLATALKNLAELHQALGEVEVARQYCQQALALATELGIPLAAECEALQLQLDET